MFTRIMTAALAAAALAACGENASQAAAPAAASASLSEAAATGRDKFGPCAVCHSVREGDNSRIGPSLYGVYGRRAGTLDGFAFSKAMAESNIVWTEETLDLYLENPPAFIRGNRMAFPGEKNPETRAAIIEYLETLGPADD